MTDTLVFARRARAQRTLLFHHDPGHDDATLDALGEQAASSYDAGAVEMAREGLALDLAA
jgi:hypothetical protein